jgi:hypothetical protein
MIDPYAAHRIGTAEADIAVFAGQAGAEVKRITPENPEDLRAGEHLGALACWAEMVDYRARPDRLRHPRVQRAARRQLKHWSLA